MKRDWELIRRLLIFIEESGSQHLLSEDIGVDSPDRVYYHLDQMIQGGLINGSRSTYSHGGGVVVVTGITPKGHDFIEQIRGETVWNKTKSLIKEKGLDLTCETIKAGAAAAISSMFS